MLKECLFLITTKKPQNKVHPRIDYCELMKKVEADKIDYSFYDNIFLGKVLSRFERSIRSDVSLGVKSYFLSKNYKIVFSFSERVGIPYAALRKIKKQNNKFIFMFTAWSKRQEKLLKQFNFLSEADLIVTQGGELKEYLVNDMKVPEGKLRYAQYTAVDQKFFAPETDTNPSYIFSLGETRGRDYFTFIRALQNISIPVKIAASGHMFAREKNTDITANLTPNIEIGRNYSHLEIKKLYSNSLFVVLPLYDTVFSAGATAIMESMAMGKAVIVSKSKGILDYVEDGVTGLFVEPGNINDLAEKIKYLLDNPDIARRMGENGRKKVEKDMNIDIYVEKLSRIIQELR